MMHTQANLLSPEEVVQDVHVRALRPLFSEAERSVLDIAWQDSRRVPFLSGRMATLAQRLFGLHVPSPLADPLLEALRRFALGILLRREDSEAVGVLDGAGFGKIRMEAIRLALDTRVALATSSRSR